MTDAKDITSPQNGHEPVSVNVRGLLLGIAGLVLLVILSLWGMWVLNARMVGTRSVSRPETEPSQADVRAPLVPDQRVIRQRLIEEQTQQLSGYQWMDSEQEIARIPIERAMQLVQEDYDAPQASRNAQDTEKEEQQ